MTACLASKEIGGLIRTSADDIAHGGQIVAAAQAAMRAILAQVGQVSRLVTDISQDAAHQADTVGQIGGAVARIDQATQANAALVRRSAGAAASLRAQVTRLEDAVGVLFRA